MKQECMTWRSDILQLCYGVSVGLRMAVGVAVTLGRIMGVAVIIGNGVDVNVPTGTTRADDEPREDEPDP